MLTGVQVCLEAVPGVLAGRWATLGHILYTPVSVERRERRRQDMALDLPLAIDSRLPSSGPGMDCCTAQPAVGHPSERLQPRKPLPGHCRLLERLVGGGVRSRKCLRILRAED